MPTIKKCPECGSGVKRVTGTMSRKLAGHTFTADLPADRCANAHAFYRHRDLSAFDRAVAVVLVEAGVLAGDVLRFLRGVLGLEGQELAELLGVRRETLSRWERGRRPIDLAVYTVLRQLILDRARGVSSTETFLRSRAKPRSKKLPSTVRLEQIVGE